MLNVLCANAVMTSADVLVWETFFIVTCTVHYRLNAHSADYAFTT